ncbi:MAG: bifunctional pyr operon transcriptional regulator/uracil phosphoribosyltransferase, partial [Desulfocapsa sp.]
MTSNTLLNSDEIKLAVNRISLQVLEHNPTLDDVCIVGIHT